MAQSKRGRRFKKRKGQLKFTGATEAGVGVFEEAWRRTSHRRQETVVKRVQILGLGAHSGGSGVYSSHWQGAWDP